MTTKSKLPSKFFPIYLDGAKSWSKGEKRVNPYPLHTDERNAWYDGYDDMFRHVVTFFEEKEYMNSTVEIDTEFWNEVTFLTNQTLDDILENPAFLPALGLKQGLTSDVDRVYPLTDEEFEYCREDRLGLIGIETPHDLAGGDTVVYHGKKYHAPVVEFHFRNDATRHKWGDVPLEVDMPLPETVLPIAEECWQKAERRLKAFGGFAKLEKTGYISTDDRYALRMFISFEWIIATFGGRSDEYNGFLRTLFV